LNLLSAILGTSVFDVTAIDADSITLVGVAPLRSSLKDVATPFEPFTGKYYALDCTIEGPDGFLDLILKFDTHEVVQAVETSLGQDVEDREIFILSLSGNLQDGAPILGEDVIVIKGKGKH